MPEKGQRSHEPPPPTVACVVVSEVYTSTATGQVHLKGDHLRVSPIEAEKNAADLAVLEDREGR